MTTRTYRYEHMQAHARARDWFVYVNRHCINYIHHVCRMRALHIHTVCVSDLVFCMHWRLKCVYVFGLKWYIDIHMCRKHRKCTHEKICIHTCMQWIAIIVKSELYSAQRSGTYDVVYGKCFLQLMNHTTYIQSAWSTCHDGCTQRHIRSAHAKW